MADSCTDRLLAGLAFRGVSGRGMNTRIAEKTGYTLSMIGKALSGKVVMGERFVKVVCNAFGINEEWVLTGQEPILDKAFPYAPSAEPQEVTGQADVAMQEAFRLLQKLSDSDRWRAVATLKDFASSLHPPAQDQLIAVEPQQRSGHLLCGTDSTARLASAEKE